jgi:Kef-type K+ transport system membrane component KefB
MDLNLAIFIGATLTATSVGLTMRVLSEMNKINSIEGKIILGAAVIDDIIGLIILSVLIDIASTGAVDVMNMGKIAVLAVVFLALTAFIGRKLEVPLLNLTKKLRVQRSFIVTVFAFVLVMSFLADLIGLATIVGAFAAGLILEREEHLEHITRKTHVLTQLFAPVFFVVAGTAVDLNSFSDISLIPFIIILTIIAVIGKVVAGIGAFREKASKLAIGIGMVPRGEVGLIFASVGLSYGLVSGGIYSALVLVIMITTFITPPLLKHLLEKKKMNSFLKFFICFQYFFFCFFP